MEGAVRSGEDAARAALTRLVRRPDVHGADRFDVVEPTHRQEVVA
jgi:hypothetical protein